MGAILRFTLIMGALSSVFDVITFAMLSQIFHVSPDVFRTAWFVESTATQTLVIFVIRTRSFAWNSRISPLLVASSLGALVVAFAIVAMPIGAGFGFADLPTPLLFAITTVVIAYLVSADFTKTVAMRGAKDRIS
jgi:Mg2+-importing ATPase